MPPGRGRPDRSPGGRTDFDPAPGWRITGTLRPRRRSSSSRSLISYRGPAGCSPRGCGAGSWMNAPVAAEPVTTGCGIVLEDGPAAASGAARLCGTARTGGSGDSSAGRRCGRRRRGGGGAATGAGASARLRRRGSLDHLRLSGRPASARRASAAIGAGGSGGARRRLRRSRPARGGAAGGGRTGARLPPAALFERRRMTVSFEPHLFQVLQPLAVDGAADAVDVDRLRDGTCGWRPRCPCARTLLTRSLGEQVQILGQLVEARAAALRGPPVPVCARIHFPSWPLAYPLSTRTPMVDPVAATLRRRVRQPSDPLLEGHAQSTSGRKPPSRGRPAAR